MVKKKSITNKNKTKKDIIKKIDKRKIINKKEKIIEKTEHIVSRLIPYALIVLTTILVLELGFQIKNHTVHAILVTLDYIVISIFVTDLIFIARKCNTAIYFFKNYRLDILAVFPFVLTFNLINEFYRVFALTKKFKLGQSIIHESLEVRKGVAVAARTGKIARYIRIGARTLRIITKTKFLKIFKK